MPEQEIRTTSGKMFFQRGILRENPVLMQCLGLFPAIVLATSLKSAAIVAAASAILLIVMECLTALVLKKLPFWLRIGLYALLSFGMLAGGMAACERLLPNLLGTLSGYLPLLAVNALIVFRCETCAAHHSVRVSLLDALGASLGYAAVLGLLGFFRELLGSGAVLGHTFDALPRITGLLMPFGGFLLLGFMAAAVKWLHHFRHHGEDELATPVAHVDEDDVSVVEPLARLFRKKTRSAVQAAPVLETAAVPVKKGKPAKANTEKEPDAASARRAAEKRERAGKQPTREPAEKPVREAKKRPAQEPAEQPARREREKRQPPKPAPEPPSKQRAERKPPETNVPSKGAPPAAPPVRAPRQEEETESFADVLAALNRRRAEQERKVQGAAGRDDDQKGEKQP